MRIRLPSGTSASACRPTVVGNHAVDASGRIDAERRVSWIPLTARLSLRVRRGLIKQLNMCGRVRHAGRAGNGKLGWRQFRSPASLSVVPGCRQRKDQVTRPRVTALVFLVWREKQDVTSEAAQDAGKSAKCSPSGMARLSSFP